MAMRPSRQAWVNDDTAPTTPMRQHLGRLVGDEPVGSWAARTSADDVGEVHVAALAQQLGVAGVGPLDVEQREVAGVLGVEPHAGLGALADARQGIGVGSIAAAWALRRRWRIVRTSSANSACLVGKYQ